MGFVLTLVSHKFKLKLLQVSSVVACFFLAMTMFPDVREKAQQELSQMLGDGVLPTVNDCSRLPYVDAVIKETIRWGVPAPLGE